MTISIFSGLYWRLTKIYGQLLWYWLAGFDCEYNAIVREDLFITIGLICTIVTAVMAFLFYFIRHEKFSGFISWIVVMLFTAIINLFIGFGMSNNERPDMPSWAVYGVNQVECPPEDEAIDEFDSEEVESDGCGCDELVPVEGATPQITSGTCWLFGLANAIVSIGLFFIISIIVKRFSLSTRHTPWRSLWPKK